MTAPGFEYDPRHFPVLLNEVLEALAPKQGERMVDGTFGAGGYTRALLSATDCLVWAIDRDPHVVPTAEAMEQEFPGRFRLLKGCFSQMKELLAEEGIDQVDGVALDIGVSSMQLDEAERGFSFMQDGPLDMRMGGDVPSAADVVNETDEEDLANIIYRYGEEHKSRRIARAIVEARREEPIMRTRQLAEIVSRAVGHKKTIRGKKQIHPATRTFQALRIYVNDELGELERGLEAAEQILSPGGRLCVVTFHSLEDRIVKNFFRERSGELARGSRHLPQANEPAAEPTFEMIFRGGKKPSQEEINQNARSRSAKLRAGRRTAAPAREREEAA
ncbi:16S rRNA (cytosine(1402)-N(4))-methyltransferase RsmH [Emcibacter nanhaiensis]|uniref:Ribosomal RNA small subunit methyltransferase H n=1 Tax=Emcibacter nanhaiensis TaxID=1505037 RepID=A0A501PC14_9PROT|nr:16S rRNA (cytosine(1402)-N(4))-methyltransferase RsmH [Emcibacter nanhaiensis]TPD57631.1 16S rRNA (cytosine(1402)-N(4))-methyltransferase RsmH [Emcibacter nanhaiensis]